MLNLRAIASPLVSIVNPMRYATVRLSAGYTTSPDGARVPKYENDNPADVYVRVQSLAQKELDHLDGLNIQGVVSAAYIEGGNWSGCVRSEVRGGDLLTIDGADWLIVTVLENWDGDNAGVPGWVKAAITRQL